MGAPHVFVSYTVLDAKGKKATTQINLDEGSADAGHIAVLVDFAKTTASIIDAVIKGQIIDIGIGLAVTLEDSILKTSPDADSDVEEGARFQFSTLLTTLTGLRLPTFDEAHMLAGTNVVDLADADVDAFVDRMTDGRTVTLVNVSPTDDRGEDITAISSARESFQSSRT